MTRREYKQFDLTRPPYRRRMLAAILRIVSAVLMLTACSAPRLCAQDLRTPFQPAEVWYGGKRVDAPQMRRLGATTDEEFRRLPDVEREFIRPQQPTEALPMVTPQTTEVWYGGKRFDAPQTRRLGATTNKEYWRLPDVESGLVRPQKPTETLPMETPPPVEKPSGHNLQRHVFESQRMGVMNTLRQSGPDWSLIPARDEFTTPGGNSDADPVAPSQDGSERDNFIPEDAQQQNRSSVIPANHESRLWSEMDWSDASSKLSPYEKRDFRQRRQGQEVASDVNDQSNRRSTSETGAARPAHAHAQPDMYSADPHSGSPLGTALFAVSIFAAGAVFSFCLSSASTRLVLQQLEPGIEALRVQARVANDAHAPLPAPAPERAYESTPEKEVEPPKPAGKRWSQADFLAASEKGESLLFESVAVAVRQEPLEEPRNAELESIFLDQVFDANVELCEQLSTFRRTAD